MTLDLPTGPRGRMLALSLTVIVAAVLWFGVVGPMWSWYAARAEILGERQALAQRMEALAATLPQVETQAASLSAGNAAPDALLVGATDAIAAASLQERLQGLASKAGVQLASVEILPASAVGQLRRIGLRVALQAEMARLVRLLGDIELARPRMLLADLDLQRHLVVARPTEPDLDARFVVYGFRAGSTPEKPR